MRTSFKESAIVFLCLILHKERKGGWRKIFVSFVHKKRKKLKKKTSPFFVLKKGSMMKMIPLAHKENDDKI